jgi:hypothetical protein
MYRIYMENYTTLLKEIKRLDKCRFSMFMDMKAQYCKGVSASQPIYSLKKSPKKSQKILCGY